MRSKVTNIQTILRHFRIRLHFDKPKPKLKLWKIFMSYIALILFAVIMLLIYWRPLGLPLWIFSTLGALLSFALGIVDLGDIGFVWGMVWNSTLALIGLIILTLALEKLGFFAFLSQFIIRLCATTPTPSNSCIYPAPFICATWKFFLYFVLFGAALGSFFANDGAILILTPLIFALFSQSQTSLPSQNPKITSKCNLFASFSPLIIFLLLGSFISDFASNALVISNLTNIITAQYFKISFLDFARTMFLPQLLVILVSWIMFWIVLGRYLPKNLDFYPLEDLASKSSQNPTNTPNTTDLNTKASTFTIVFSFCLLGTILIGITLGEQLKIPICFWTLLSGILAVLYGGFIGIIKPFALLKESPFGVVIFSFGLFTLVFGLKKSGILNFLEEWILDLSLFDIKTQIFAIGFGSSLGSSVINNLPMVMLGDLALQENPHLAYAHLLGCNIGSKLTPIGSLATLLWLESLKRYGIKIGFKTYMITASLITIPVLSAGLLGIVLN